MNTRDLGIGKGPGKGDKPRISDIKRYRENFDAINLSKPHIVRSVCCEAPYNTDMRFEDGVPKTYKRCDCCGNPCELRVFEIK